MKPFFALLLSIAGMISGCHGQSAENRLSPKAFAEKLGKTENPQLIDVRTSGEYAGGHIGAAANIDWNGRDFDTQVSGYDKTKPVFVYCMGGVRSARAARKLSEMGFTEVYDLDGGIVKWNAEGLSETPAPTTPIGICPQEYGDLTKSGKVLVNFYAPWCEPCQKMKPFMERLEKENGPTRIVRLDGDAHKTMMTELKIDRLPALFLYENGVLTWTHTGYISEDELKKKL